MSDVKITGVHHIALKARGVEAYEKTLAFYHDLLGLPIVRRWGTGENLAAFVDTGAGYLEIFSNAPDELGEGALRHLALTVENTDACIEAVRAAGYAITMEPKDLVIPSEPPVCARIGFCEGPVGEAVEFFQIK